MPIARGDPEHEPAEVLSEIKRERGRSPSRPSTSKPQSRLAAPSLRGNGSRTPTTSWHMSHMIDS
jgi:hypothetical protein